MIIIDPRDVSSFCTGMATGIVVTMMLYVGIETPAPALVGYGCEVGQGELRTLYAEMEDDFPSCIAIVPNE